MVFVNSCRRPFINPIAAVVGFNGESFDILAVTSCTSCAILLLLYVVGSAAGTRADSVLLGWGHFLILVVT